MQAPDEERLERALATAWPARVVEHAGPWWLRAAHGFTKRANSALALGEVTPEEIPPLLEATRAFAQRHGIPPRVHVASTARTASVRSTLATGPWHVESGNEVLTTQLRERRGQVRGVALDPRPSDAWLATWSHVLHGRSAVVEPGRALFARMPSPVAFLSIVPTGTARPDAVGVGVVVDGILGLFGVAVRARARGGGLGTRVVDAAHGWGLRHGARHAAVQVVAVNAAAVRLYRRAGYRRSHSTRFWRADAPTH